MAELGEFGLPRSGVELELASGITELQGGGELTLPEERLSALIEKLGSGLMSAMRVPAQTLAMAGNKIDLNPGMETKSAGKIAHGTVAVVQTVKRHRLGNIMKRCDFGSTKQKIVILRIGPAGIEKLLMEFSFGNRRKNRPADQDTGKNNQVFFKKLFQTPAGTRIVGTLGACVGELIGLIDVPKSRVR